MLSFIKDRARLFSCYAKKPSLNNVALFQKTIETTVNFVEYRISLAFYTYENASESSISSLKAMYTYINFVICRWNPRTSLNELVVRVWAEEHSGAWVLSSQVRRYCDNSFTNLL